MNKDEGRKPLNTGESEKGEKKPNFFQRFIRLMMLEEDGGYGEEEDESTF